MCMCVCVYVCVLWMIQWREAAGLSHKLEMGLDGQAPPKVLI